MIRLVMANRTDDGILVAILASFGRCSQMRIQAIGVDGAKLTRSSTGASGLDQMSQNARGRHPSKSGLHLLSGFASAEAQQQRSAP